MVRSADQVVLDRPRVGVVEGLLPPDTLEQMVELYRRAFAPLATLTATRQTLDPRALVELLDDPTSATQVAYVADGSVAGFCLGVRDLTAIDWINPEFFAHHYPDEFREGRVAFCPAFVIDPAHQKTGVFLPLARAVAAYWGEHDSVLCMDCCQYNVEEENLPEILRIAASRETATSLRRLDSQVYWAFELGRAAR